MSWKELAEQRKNQDEGGQKKGGGDLFMSTKGGGKFTIRFVGEAKQVHIMWYPQVGGKKYIVPDNYLSKMKALGFPVRTLIVSNVIDRDDEKLRFKLLEKGPKVYGPVITRYQEVLDDNDKPIHPGGPRGEDWRLIVTIPADPRNTSYEISPLKVKPFTDAEKDLIRREKDPEAFKDLEIGERGRIDIDKIYNAEKYIEKLDELIAAKEAELGQSEVPTAPASSTKTSPASSTKTAADVDLDIEDTSLDDIAGIVTVSAASDEGTDEDINDILF